MATRILGPTGSKRRKRFLLGPILAVAALALFFAVGAQAVHTEGIFELDRNAVNNAAVAGNDWDQVFAGASTNCASLGTLACSFDADPANATIFTGGGSKDINDLNQWQSSAGSVPDKDEIDDAYSAMYVGPPASDLAGHQILYFGADRHANNGSSDFGFWFFKSSVSTNADGTFSGVHTVGDVLLLSTFTTGGATTTIRAFRWVGSGGSDGALDSLGTSLPDCVPGPAAGDAGCGTVNALSTPSPWPYTPKSGPSGSFPSGSFFEGGVDLTQLNVAGCFSSFLAETRSSPSTTATLKDYVLGSFTPCKAKISITPTATNEVGTNHTFTINVQKLDPSTGFVFGGANGVTVTTSKTDSNGASSSYVPAGQNTCTTAVNGTCTVTITSPTAGQTTVNASGTVPLQGGGSVSVTTNGTGGSSGPAVKTWVDASITIGPNDTNEVGDSHTFTVTVKKNAGDGAGFVAATSGHVTVTLTDSNGAASSIDTAASTCDDAGSNLDASGQCTLKFSSPSGGTVTGNASVTLTVGGVSLTRSTSGNAGPGGSGAATKVFVDANITIGPNDTNEVGDSHTFTVTVKKNAGDGAGFVAATSGHVTVTLTDSNGAASSIDTAASTCDDAGSNLDASGQCTLKFSSPSTGTVTGNASVTLTVGGVSLTRSTSGNAGPGGSGAATKVFVDAKIGVSPLTDTDGITELHTITATVQQDNGSGSGFSNAPNGTLVTFSLLNNTATATFVGGVNTCTTTAGSCSIQITSTTAGSVDVHATTTFSVGGVSLTRATGTGGNNSANANKVFVDGTLRWLKHDQDGNPLGGATFRVCRTANFNSSTGMFDSITPVCVNDAGTPPDVIDNGSFDQDPDAGEFQLNHLILGRYTIHETIAPAGYQADPDTETVELTVASPSNIANPPVFVDVRQFKLIVITCNQSTNGLVVSSVTLNGVTKDTIAGVPASLMGTTPAITQSNICDIGGASYGNLNAGTYVPSVLIPKP